MKNNKLTYTKKNLKEFDRLTFAIFLCIQDMAKSGCNYVSKEMILCQINDSKNKNIKHEIDNLCSLGFINKVMTNCYHINRELFDLKDDFAIITTEEFYKITNHKCKNSLALLHHFCCLIASIDYNLDVNGVKNIIGHMSAKYFAKEYNLAINSVRSYNKTLQEIGLLYVKNQYCKETQEYGTNLYSRFSNSSFVDMLTNINYNGIM